MIEIDPVIYFGENHLVQRRCPHCRTPVWVRLRRLARTLCAQCARPLAGASPSRADAESRPHRSAARPELSVRRIA